jgi:hypothetical protein
MHVYVIREFRDNLSFRKKGLYYITYNIQNAFAIQKLGPASASTKRKMTKISSIFFLYVIKL